MRLPHTRWALDLEPPVLAEPLVGGERLDPAPFQCRLEGEVEVAQRLSAWKARQHERRAYATLVARAQFVFEHPVEEAVRRRLLGHRLGQPGRQLLGGVQQAELRQPLARDVEIHRRARRAAGLHRATSASATYKSSGRVCGAMSAIAWSRRPMRPSGSGGSSVAVASPS